MKLYDLIFSLLALPNEEIAGVKLPKTPSFFNKIPA
jgi:hypothetical protein